MITPEELALYSSRYTLWKELEVCMTKEELTIYIKLQPFFNDRLKEWQVGDWGYDTIRKISFCIVPLYAIMLNACNDNILHLPLPIDPRSPERGLWGMVDKTKFRIDLHHLGATLTQMYSNNTPFDIKTYPTPTVALLRALECQWGIEVEG